MPFTPTEQQIQFRDHAREMWQSGTYMVAEWVLHFEDESLTVGHVNRWLADDEFTDWWREAFPEHAPVTALDAHTLDFLARQALSSGLAKSNPKHLAVWQRMKAAEQAAKQLNTPTSQSDEIASFIGDGTSGGWGQTQVPEAR